MLNLIPREMINRDARETGVEQKFRTFTVVSHLGTKLLAPRIANLMLSRGQNQLDDVVAGNNVPEDSP